MLHAEAASSAEQVSVPLRGFRGLQGRTATIAMKDWLEDVSVPLRGFRGLQAHPTLPYPALMGGFQSPCGVLGVCRPGRRFCKRRKTAQVSVPLRGFRGLQDSPEGHGRKAVSRFSPLAGF